MIGREESHERDSFGDDGLLDHPHYTRPPEFRGMRVPEVLLSGNHAEIERWRREAALEKTRRNAPRPARRLTRAPARRLLPWRVPP